MHISLKRLRIAIPTKGKGGLEDIVSDVFGRASTLTIVEVEKGMIKNVKALKNPAVSYKHGAGPIVVKMLIDTGVNMILASELGPGASALLQQHNVTTITAESGTSVKEAVVKGLSDIEK